MNHTSPNPVELFKSLPGALSITACNYPPEYDRDTADFSYTNEDSAVFTDLNSAARFHAAFPDWRTEWSTLMFIPVTVDPNWVPQGISASPAELYKRIKKPGRGWSFDADAQTVRFREFNQAALFKCVFPDWKVEYVFESALELYWEEVDLEMPPYV